MSAPVSVHVWSDVICPWCFIGKRRFERALADFDGEVTVEYHSFELAPDTPVDFDGSEVDFLVDHKGMPRAQVEQMLAQVTELAAAEGLAFDFSTSKQTKTLKAHELLHHAKAKGVQPELVERLFAAHFEQGGHVGRDDALAALAADVGLDADEVRTVLAAGTYRDAVQADIATARQLGIRGVPFYVIGEKYGISGAQSPEVFAEALRRAAADQAADAEAASAVTA
ncbi:DsbA family protein [Cellulomonas fimi]|uniref:DsbA family oxidoreductase n=1 Tax=Cellulomonas fimi TaxID=1708 RepID=A0A7Y0QIA0_CELFI|nr:DsbA family oxidoreductase [Cellulomonas fimi]NMR20684.1 DsbA family oxidoreductase [Cellulomonas fimi]